MSEDTLQSSLTDAGWLVEQQRRDRRPDRRAPKSYGRGAVVPLNASVGAGTEELATFEAALVARNCVGPDNQRHFYLFAGGKGAQPQIDSLPGRGHVRAGSQPELFSK